MSVFSPAPRKHYLNITPGNILQIYPPDPQFTSSQTLVSRNDKADNSYYVNLFSNKFFWESLKNKVADLLRNITLSQGQEFKNLIYAGVKPNTLFPLVKQPAMHHGHCGQQAQTVLFHFVNHFWIFKCSFM